MNFNPFRSTAGTQLDANGITPDRPGSGVDSFEAEFQQLKTRVHREILDALDLSRIAEMDDDQLRVHFRQMAEALLSSRPEMLSAVDQERLVDDLLAESFGLGPLEPYMHDPDVTDILVNGPHEVYVERSGRLQETNTVFADEEHLLQIISRIVARVGRHIDERSPMVDARLPDGSRVNAIIPPLALNGPTLSIRRFGAQPLMVEDLLRFGSICPEMIQLLEAAIEGRLNIMISGGTGAGKTTLLNNLSRYIPMGERLVTIEDSAELLLQRKHVVSLETRPENAEGTGAITQRDLVRNSLRMRPDRILLGEVRSGEALDMLQAMNTGHEGSMTTIHANDTDDALSRLEVMVSMAGFDLPVSVVRRYIASAITVLVHVARLKGGVRRVMRISEISGLDGNEYRVQQLFGFRQSGVDDNGMAQGHFYAAGNCPSFLERLSEVGIDIPISLFEERRLESVTAQPNAPTVMEPTDTPTVVGRQEPESTVFHLPGEPTALDLTQAAGFGAVAPAESVEEFDSSDEPSVEESPGAGDPPIDVANESVADENDAEETMTEGAAPGELTQRDPLETVAPQESIAWDELDLGTDEPIAEESTDDEPGGDASQDEAKASEDSLDDSADELKLDDLQLDEPNDLAVADPELDLLDDEAPSAAEEETIADVRDPDATIAPDADNLAGFDVLDGDEQAGPDEEKQS